MTWQNLPPEIREIAERVLAPVQLRIFQLGLEYPEGRRFRPLAFRLGISKTHVVDTWDTAHRHLNRAGVTVDAQGHYHHKEPT